ncbi:MAG TPA: fumarylacetoacetate hydrolase family protein [Methylomirabilota bacterium]|nr:fumarylacetoacetate hydrolase family protein [Methylomirabilota bacterium]
MTPGVLSAVSATGQHLIRLDDGMYLKREGVLSRLPDGTSMDALLRQPLDELRRFLGQDRPAASLQDGAVLEAPIESQEVWAAGVTYQRSLQARADEAVSSDPYDRVYTAERPEIFFKATAGRVRGPGQAVYIRSDSSWDVPEPELAVICNSRVEVVGYTIGNDMSSRSIEGENPLYLPQAKVFDGCCALGPAVALAWDFSPSDRKIELDIRRNASIIYRSETSTSSMRRSILDLVDYLGRDQRFEAGCVLLTGTGIVPPSDFTLQDGDEVSIRIDGIGLLENPVRRHASRGGSDHP